jgi:hypothetical protein
MRAYKSLLLLIVASAASCSTSATPPSSSTSPEGGTDDPSREPILDGGGVVPTPPHGEDLCPPGCNYQTGKGCGEGGAASCVPLPSAGSVAPACEPAGNVPFGGDCTQWTDCVSGAVCAKGKCLKLCCGKDWTGCPDGQHCLSAFDVQIAPGKVVSSQAFLCIPVNQCDALVPSSCTEPGTTCQLADGTGATACLPEGTATAPDPCQPTVCKGGFTCVNNGCRRLCKAVAGGGEPSCPLEEGRCVHFNRDPPGVGECTPN